MTTSKHHPKIEVGEEVVHSKPLGTKSYPGDSEERPQHTKDPEAEAREEKELVLGAGKPIELAFRQRLTAQIGICHFEEEGEGEEKIIRVRHSRGEGTVSVPFLLKEVARGNFKTFCERFGKDLTR